MSPSRPLGLARFLAANALGLLVVLGGLALLPSSVAAQTGAAQFTGIITDHSGAAVPGVTVTATNQATQVAYTNVTNNAGAYSIQGLPIGAYVVKAEITGFAPKTTTPITLEAAQIGRLDFQLDVTGVT